MLRRPVWLTSEGAHPPHNSHPAGDVEEGAPVEQETPDRSYVAPPPVEPATRDEAIELIERRLDVLAARADRMDRNVEALSPVSIDDLPTRSEFRATDERSAANLKRIDELSHQLTTLIESEGRTAATREQDRATMLELASAKSRLEERLRDFAEELADVRQSSAGIAESVRTLREALADREAFQVSALSQRLAGVYTIAIVALLAAVLTLVLQLTMRD